MDDLTEEQVVSRFRFTKTQLEKLFVVLRFPDKMHGSCRVAWNGMEGLLVLLRCLSYPNKLRELAEEFGRSKAALSIVFNTTLIWFARQWGHIPSPGLTSRRLVLKRILLLLLLWLVLTYVCGVLSTGLSVLYAGHP